MLKEYVSVIIPNWLKIFDGRLRKVGTGFMATKGISIADFAVWDLTCTWLEHEHWKEAFGDALAGLD